MTENDFLKKEISSYYLKYLSQDAFDRLFDYFMIDNKDNKDRVFLVYKKRFISKDFRALALFNLFDKMLNKNPKITI